MSFLRWQRLKWVSRLLSLPVPEPTEHAARILDIQRNIVLPVRVLLMAVVFYYLFHIRLLSQLDQPEPVLEMLQHYFIFYMVVIAAASTLLILRRFPVSLVQWVVFVVGLLDGLLLAGLTVETGGFASNLFWVFPGLIVLNALSIPLATPQIVLNLCLSAFYVGAGLLYTNLSGDIIGPPSLPFPGAHRSSPSTISPGEIINLPSFAAKLRRQADPVSQDLWSRFSQETRQAILAYDGADTNNQPVQARLAEELSQIVRGGSIYDQSRFAGIKLSDDTRGLLAHDDLKGDRFARLNRLLIEDAYPAEVEKRHKPKPGERQKFMGNLTSQGSTTPEPEPGAEPFLLRLIILWLLTSSCYGVQLLSFRDQQARQDAREAAARNSELKAAGRLAAEIAHQLKNPLGIINNAVFSLERGLRQGKQDLGQQIEIIREEIERSDRIITQLMGYAQLSEGRVEKLSVPEELERAINEVFPPGASYTTQIHRDYSPNLPSLMMQRIHLSAVLVNLLQNAREALNGHGNIHLTAQAHRDSSVEIIVADDGPGIASDKLSRIFDPYFTSKTKGTGLGLAIVKHNVELYGGSLSVESKLGKGARFVLLFPTRTF